MAETPRENAHDGRTPLQRRFGWKEQKGRIEGFAADLAARLDVPAGGSVLETACGTGISTEFLARALPDDVELVATDLSEPMLAFARGLRGQLPGVRFEGADACRLPHADASQVTPTRSSARTSVTPAPSASTRPTI